MMDKILVAGAFGRLGTILCKKLHENGYIVYRLARLNANLNSNFSACLRELKLLIDTFGPDAVINLVANADVDKCELEPDSAYVSNVLFVRLLTSALKNTSCKFIHISTDQVYSNHGYSAEEDVNPINVYGKTKLEGDILARDAGATVLRVNYVGKSLMPNKPLYTDWLIDLLLKNEKITLFADVLFNPVHSGMLTEAIIRTLKNIKAGIYNFSSEDGLSKADFSLQISSQLKISSHMVTIGASSDIGLVAKRPLNMLMDSSLFSRTFNYELPKMSQVISQVCKDYSINHE